MRRWLAFSCAVFLLSSCYVFKAYRFRKFELADLNKFDAAALPASAKPFAFAYDTVHNVALKTYLDENLAASQSYAFLVVRNDSILYERYFENVTESTVLPSFSAAKSVTSTLLGIALHEGYIKSLQEPVTNYLPQLRKRDGRFDSITIQHVLNMRSGIKSNESYTNPFSDVLKMGFARNVSKPVLKMKTEKAPGEFEYKSANTQLLALIVEKATGRKLQDYAIEKLWKPLQMEAPATWNTDKHNTVRAFCCINAAARDYARFGRLALRNGEWQGQQLVPKEWFERSVNADSMFRYGGYHNQWWAQSKQKSFADAAAAQKWLDSTGVKGEVNAKENAEGKMVCRAHGYDGSFYAAGLLGQYVYVNPKKNLVIVRLGHDWSHPKMYAVQFIHALAERL